MKIQEMRSGILHLNKRMQTERRRDIFELGTANEPSAAPEENSPAPPICELDEPRWAVISFEQIEAGGLTYAQAGALINELDSHKIPGLCIITDEAAARLRG